jgi:hypothetical protein
MTRDSSWGGTAEAGVSLPVFSHRVSLINRKMLAAQPFLSCRGMSVLLIYPQRVIYLNLVFLQN